MTIRTTVLGGIDWIDGEILYAADLNNTVQELLKNQWPRYLTDFTTILASEPNQDVVLDYPVLSFSATATNSADTYFSIPRANYTGDLTIDIVYTMDTTNAGDVRLQAEIKVSQPGSTMNTGATTLTETVTSMANANVFDVKTLGTIKIANASLSASLQNDIGIRFSRLGADGADTHTGRFLLVALVIRRT